MTGTNNNTKGTQVEIKHTTTGTLEPAQLLGDDGEGNAVYLAIEGYEPTCRYVCDSDGNWIVPSSRLHGYKAIAFAESYDLKLSKYSDPTEDARSGLSVEQARDVAHADPSLIYCDM